jgi:ribosome-associated toxin RatA of RatAB toxin-antitoxin module
MTTIKRSLLVTYTPTQMFELVNAIEQYPEFLPWCKSTTVHSRTEEEVRASIVISKKGVQQSFTTLNRLQPNKMIEVRLIEGPFRRLQGYWHFEAVGEEGCQITFNLEFEFTSKLIGFTVGPLLEKVAHSFIDAFHQRAKEVYGK